MEKEKITFMECETCNAKSGSPVLCSGCLHNRNAIDMLIAVKKEMIPLETLKRDGTVYDKAVEDGNDFFVRTLSFYTAAVLTRYGYKLHSIATVGVHREEHTYYFLTRDYKNA